MVCACVTRLVAWALGWDKKVHMHGKSTCLGNISRQTCACAGVAYGGGPWGADACMRQPHGPHALQLMDMLD